MSPIVQGTNRPVPVWARLAVTEAESKKMQKLGTRKEMRTALKVLGERAINSLEPKLQGLRAEGLISDYATSLVLAEMVVHTTEEHRAAVVERLRGFSEVDEVSSNVKAARARIRER